jgi:hypothetical protein
MKKILFITSHYYPKPDANGVCVHEIANELFSKGYEVDIVALGRRKEEKKGTYDGINVYKVGLPFYKWLKEYSLSIKNPIIKRKVYGSYELLNRVSLLLHMPFYPVTSFITVFKYWFKIYKLHKKNNYSTIIATYKPIDSILAALIMKRVCKDIQIVLYILDSFPNSGGGKYLSSLRAEKRGKRWEKLIYPSSDLVINMKCHEKYYEKNSGEYLEFKSKMRFSDFPLIKPRKSNDEKRFKYHRLVYTGNLDRQMRSPEYACEIFNRINNYKFKVDFYSAGNCEEILREYSLKSDKIFRHGFVAQQESILAIDEATILLNIGNKDTDMVPSKLFLYMSTGKPIIHFYHDESDSCLPYLMKYPLSLLVKMNKDQIEENILRVSNFMVNHELYDCINLNSLEEIFNFNTPSYTVKLIESGLKYAE